MHHSAWGYIDNPSLTPAVGWLSQRLFGDSALGLRVLPAVEVDAERARGRWAYSWSVPTPKASNQPDVGT